MYTICSFFLFFFPKVFYVSFPVLETHARKNKKRRIELKTETE